MEFSYALSRLYPDAPYVIYGKGVDAESAEADATRNISDDDPDAAALRANLTVVGRSEAESRGLVKGGAPVVWYAHLHHYVTEDHAAPMSGTAPTGVTYR